MTAKEYIKAYTRCCSNELVGGGYHEWLTPENALAAVELAREEMKEPASEDLEREMNRYFETMQVLEHEYIFEDTFQRIAKHFAQWQGEQMMKDAVEADIAESFTPVSESPDIYMHGFTCVYEEKESTPYVVAPCKVKLIIIKE